MPSLASTYFIHPQIISLFSCASPDVREGADGSHRRVTFLNPWISTTRHIQSPDSHVLIDGFQDLSLGENAAGVGRSAGNAISDQNLVDVAWDNVCDVFDGIYLNWDPLLFKNSVEFHGYVVSTTKHLKLYLIQV